MTDTNRTSKTEVDPSEPTPWRLEVDLVRKVAKIIDAAGHTIMCNERYYPWCPNAVKSWELIVEAVNAYTRPAVETAALTEAEELLKAWADRSPPNGKLYWAHVEKAREYFKKRPAVEPSPRHLTEPERDAMNRAADASASVVDEGFEEKATVIRHSCTDPGCVICRK